MNLKKSSLLNRRTIIAAFSLVGIAIACTFLGKPILDLASDPSAFRNWVGDRGIWGKIAYMAMVIIQIFAAFIPGEPLEIAGGYAFGAVEGTILCLLAGAIGSAIVILLVRRFGMQLVSLFFPAEKVQSLHFLRSSKKRTILFLIIFMIPGTPKDLLCYFAGLTDIRFPVLAFICSLGRIPSVVTSTIGGNALGNTSYVFAIVVFAVTFAISIAGLAIYNFISTRHAAKADKKP